jgi:predicted ATP-grasp superfamily ATP-dependent carboligase
LKRSGGLNVFETHAAACRGALASLDLSPPPEVLGKGILWARREIVVGDTRGWLARDDVRDVPFPGERIRRGHPICTVFASGRVSMMRTVSPILAPCSSRAFTEAVRVTCLP